MVPRLSLYVGGYRAKADTIAVVNLMVGKVEVEKGLCSAGHSVQGAVPDYNCEAGRRAGEYECAGG